MAKEVEVGAIISPLKGLRILSPKGDALEVIFVIKGEEYLMLRNLIQDILNFLKLFNFINFEYVSRDINKVAHQFAKFSFDYVRDVE